MKDERKTKKQLIEEMDGLRGENIDLREKVAGIDVDAVKAQAGRGPRRTRGDCHAGQRDDPIATGALGVSRRSRWILCERPLDAGDGTEGIPTAAGATATCDFTRSCGGSDLHWSHVRSAWVRSRLFSAGFVFRLWTRSTATGLRMSRTRRSGRLGSTEEGSAVVSALPASR